MNQPSGDKNFLTVSGLARTLGVTPRTVRSWLAKEIIRPTQRIRKGSQEWNVFSKHDVERIKRWFGAMETCGVKLTKSVFNEIKGEMEKLIKEHKQFHGDKLIVEISFSVFFDENEKVTRIEIGDIFEVPRNT